MTGREFVIDACDGKFTSEDLNAEGNAFAAAYYNVGYLDEYRNAVDAGDLETIYHVANSHENRAKVAALLDQRFGEWKTGTLQSRPITPKPPWWKFWAK